VIAEYPNGRAERRCGARHSHPGWSLRVTAGAWPRSAWSARSRVGPI